jgi:hypothetical protein
MTGDTVTDKKNGGIVKVFTDCWQFPLVGAAYQMVLLCDSTRRPHPEGEATAYLDSDFNFCIYCLFIRYYKTIPFST